MMQRQPESPRSTDAFGRLAGELRRAFRAWEEDPSPWPTSRFGDLALGVFRLQYAENLPYRRYCDARGRTPRDVDDWREIPPAPTAAFREVDLVVGSPETAELTFRTSGTTRGPGRRGRHLVRDPRVYRASLEAAFRHFVLRGEEGSRVGSLVPPAGDAPDSSLSWMASAVVERFGEAGSRFLASSEGMDGAAVLGFLETAVEEGRPVCLLATTLGLDECTRRLEEEGRSYELPEGSRIMDTGGAKGREGLRRETVLRRARATLGVPPSSVVNEFGMTELLSQRYARPAPPHRGRSPVRRDGDGGGLLRAPPWLRTRALDPVTLDELPAGETGVLCHLDLANVGSVSAVLTEDLGRARDGAVEWVGRAPGAPPRGCSLATAELLDAQGSDPGHTHHA